MDAHAPAVRVTASGRSVAAQSIHGGVHYHAAPTEIEPGPVVVLPAAPAVFTGRTVERDQLRSVLRPLEDDAIAAPVVTCAVAGLGGIGKTALALHAAHDAYARGWFTDVVFVDLRGYAPAPVTAHQALDVVLRTLRVPADDIPAVPHERAGLLASVLAGLGGQGRRVLIVADNASSAAQVRPLLPAGRRHRLLVTSRHTHPDLGARLVDLDALTPDASVELIRATLRAARPADARAYETPEAARDLAAWCAGLPLALRVSAAVLVLHPEQPLPGLLDELRAERSRIDAIDAFTALTGTERALRATFDLSHQHLHPDHRHLLRLLALAPGTHIGLPAATVLAARPEPEVRAALRELTRAHLLTHTTGPTGSRWTMHDLTRDHARSPDEAGTEQDRQAIERLLDHLTVTAGRADVRLRALPGAPEPGAPNPFPDRAAALAWFDTEHDGLLAAVRTRPGPTTAQLTFRVAAYLVERRRFDEAVDVHTTAVNAFRAAGDRHNEGLALNNLGLALRELRRFEEAVTAFTAHIAIFRTRGDRRGEGQGLTHLGLVLDQLRRFDEAVAAHTTAVDIFRETGVRQDEGTALNNLGSALRAMRRSEEAVSALTSAVDISVEAGNRHGEAVSLANLGMALLDVARPEEAVTVLRAAVDILRESGDRHDEGKVLNNLGSVLRALSRLEEAAAALETAAGRYRETGDRHGEGTATDNLGLVLHDMRRYDDAIAAHTGAVALCRETGDRHGEAWALGHLGRTLQRASRGEEAVTAHTAAAGLFRETGDHAAEAEALNDLGRALRKLRRFDEAVTAHTAAVDISRDLRDHHGEGTALLNLGSALLEDLRLEEALTAQTTAVDVFRGIDDGHGEAKALTGRGLVLHVMERFEEAVTPLTEAVEKFRESGDAEGEQVSLSCLAASRDGRTRQRRGQGWLRRRGR